MVQRWEVVAVASDAGRTSADSDRSGVPAADAETAADRDDPIGRHGHGGDDLQFGVAERLAMRRTLTIVLWTAFWFAGGLYAERLIAWVRDLAVFGGPY